MNLCRIMSRWTNVFLWVTPSENLLFFFPFLFLLLVFFLFWVTPCYSMHQTCKQVSVCFLFVFYLIPFFSFLFCSSRGFFSLPTKIKLSVYLSVRSVCLSVCLCVYMPACAPACLSDDGNSIQSSESYLAMQEGMKKRKNLACQLYFLHYICLPC